MKEATHSAPRLLLSPYRTADLLLCRFCLTDVVSSLSLFLSSDCVLMPVISCQVCLALNGLCNFFSLVDQNVECFCCS